MLSDLQLSTPQVYAIVGLELLLITIARYSYTILSEQTGGDAFGNFLQIRDIRNAGNRVPDEPSQSALSGRYAYPYFVLWLLSYIPERYLQKVDGIFSPLMDLSMAFILVLLVPLGILDEIGLIVGLGLLLFTPQFMRPDQAHGKGFSQRKPGLLLTTGSLLCFLIWINYASIVALALSVLFGSLVCLTSKFSLQALTFIYIGFSVLLTPVSILIPPAAALLAITVSRGRYYHILTGHLRHVYDYAMVRQYQRFDHSLPNPISYLQTLFHISSTDDVLEFVYSTRFTKSFLNNPFLLGVIAVYSLVIVRDIDVVEFSGIHAWVAGGIACFVLISMPHLLFLGQAERYLEYIFLPSAVLIGTAVATIPGYWLVLGPLFGVGLVVQVVYLWGYKSVFEDPARHKSVAAVSKFLKEKQGDVVAVQPAYTARQIAWLTEKTVLEDIGGHSTSTPEARAEKNRVFHDEFDDYLVDDIDWFAENYEPDWVVFDSNKTQQIRQENGSVPGLKLPDTEPDYENDRFMVFDFEKISQKRQ